MTGAPVYDQWFARRPSTTREEFCAQDRPVAGQAVLPVSLLVAVHRARRGGVHRRVDPRRPIGARSARARAGHPDPPASGKPAAVAALRRSTSSRTSSLWPRGGANPVDARVEERLLRLDVSRGRRGRHQHQRADRVRHRRPSGLLGARARSTRARRKAHFTSTIC